MRAAWAATAAGPGLRLIVLTGEGGIGKTRLAAELAREAHAGGGQVLLGRCDEEPLAPYQPIAEMLRQATRGAPEPELAAILPELVPGPTIAENDPVAARARLFGAIGATLGRIAVGRPLLLLVDDLHWADRPTLLLLSHLLRFPPTDRLLLLATLRDTDVAPDGPVADWLEARRREGELERVGLRGLDEPAVAALVERWFGAADAELAQALHARTAGNALFVEEVLKRGGAASAVPGGVGDAIAARLAPLSAPAVAVLRAIAVAGRGAEPATISAVTGVRAPEVVEAVEELLAARLVREEDERGRLEFVHALMRDVVYDGLSAARRAHLHAAAAQALEAGGADAHVEEIAHHLFQARAEPGRAVDYLARAADRALRRLAYEDAADHAERALTLVDAEAHGRRTPLLLRRADAQLRAGTDSREAFAEAAAAARATGDADALARAALGFGGLGVTIIDVDEIVVARLEEALAGLGRNPALRARLNARLAVELYYSPERDRSEALSEEAVELARASGDHGALAYALNARHVALWRPDRLEERLRTTDEMLDVAGRASDPVAELQARNWRVVDFFELPERDGWLAEADAHGVLAARLRLPAYEWYTPLWQAVLAQHEGRFAEAQSLAATAGADGERAGDRNAELFAAMLGAHDGVMRAEIGELDPAFLLGKVASSPAGMAYRSMLAWSLAEEGAEEDAHRELAAVAHDRFAALPFDTNWLSAMTEVAEACRLLGARDAAAAAYARLAPYAGRSAAAGRAVVTYGVVDRALGLLAAAMGRHAEAAAHLEAAIAGNEALGFAPWAAHARAALGNVLVETGEMDRGCDELARAAAEARRLGLTGLERRLG